ncbi:MAG: transporter, family, lactate transporter [Sphingomonadales bacterium]|nr:transporter, family, lactate transporter [Sphingomonadales bacterium]
MDTTVKRTSRHTQEVAALLAVQHPNIVRLVDVRDGTTGAELALEHAAGGSLHDLLAARRRLSAGEAIGIGLAIGAALAELHRRGLVHGDVHPGNILFDDAVTMTPLLADLGSAAPIGHPAAGHGVPGCTAPEVERGAPPSPASDQWSLAAVLRAALGPVVPTPLAVVLSVALAPVPADRYASIESMAIALRHAAPAAPVRPAPRTATGRRTDAPPVTRRYGPLPPAVRRPRTRARPAFAIGLAAVALAIGAFLMQIAVQGAWGVVPAYLNEISPDEIRATFPGFVYQLGNLIASVNATMQATIAVQHGGNYAFALAVVAATASVVIAVLILFGRERRGVDMLHSAARVGEAI